MGISVSQFGYVAVLTIMLCMIAFGVVLLIAVSVTAYKEALSIRNKEKANGGIECPIKLERQV